MHLRVPARTQWSLRLSSHWSSHLEDKNVRLCYHKPGHGLCPSTSSAVPAWPVSLPVVSDSGEAGLRFFHPYLRKRVDVFERFKLFVQLFEPLKDENTFPALLSVLQLILWEPAATPALELIGSQTRMDFALFFLFQSGNAFPTAVWEQLWFPKKLI